MPHRTVREVVAIARRLALLLAFFMLYASIVILSATSHSSVCHLSLAEKQAISSSLTRKMVGLLVSKAQQINKQD
jgi:hypothetical protein